MRVCTKNLDYRSFVRELVREWRETQRDRAGIRFEYRPDFSYMTHAILLINVQTDAIQPPNKTNLIISLVAKIILNSHQSYTNLSLLLLAHHISSHARLSLFYRYYILWRGRHFSSTNLISSLSFASTSNGCHVRHTKSIYGKWNIQHMTYYI